MKTSSIILITSFAVGISILFVLVIQNPPKNSVGVDVFYPQPHLQQYWGDLAKRSNNTIIIREQREIPEQQFNFTQPRLEINGLNSQYEKDVPITFEVVILGDGTGCGSVGVGVYDENKQLPIFSQEYISICDGSGKYVGIPISFDINKKKGQIPYLGPGAYEVRVGYYQDRGSFGDLSKKFSIGN